MISRLLILMKMELLGEREHEVFILCLICFLLPSYAYGCCFLCVCVFAELQSL